MDNKTSLKIKNGQKCSGFSSAASAPAMQAHGCEFDPNTKEKKDREREKNKK